MKKRAVALSMQTIIVAVLALIVLVVVIMVLKSQVGKTSERYSDIGKQAGEGANVSSCASGLFGNRKCGNCANLNAQSKDKEAYYWHAIGKLNCEDPNVCCERGELKP